MRYHLVSRKTHAPRLDTTSLLPPTTAILGDPLLYFALTSQLAFQQTSLFFSKTPFFPLPPSFDASSLRSRLRHLSYNQLASDAFGFRSSSPPRNISCAPLRLQRNRRPAVSSHQGNSAARFSSDFQQSRAIVGISSPGSETRQTTAEHFLLTANTTRSRGSGLFPANTAGCFFTGDRLIL